MMNLYTLAFVDRSFLVYRNGHFARPNFHEKCAPGQMIRLSPKCGQFYSGAESAEFAESDLEAATGVERDSLVLSKIGSCGVTDWSPDGRFIEIVGTRGWWEYWVVQGLQEGQR